MMNKEKVVKKPGLEKILNQIIEGFHPEKVILFGSHAYGEPDRDSDVDLMVIMQTGERAMRKAAEISASIDHPFPIDILVRTPEQIRERIELGDGFIQEIITKGVVLYEAPDQRMG
jgi:predicted nucleotidyltransferase